MANLQQNFTTDIDSGLVQEFFNYCRNQNVDQSSGYEVNKAWSRFSNIAAGNNELERGLLVGPYSTDSKLYDSGPFSWQDEDLLSDVTEAGSPLLQWIPTTSTGVRNAVVSHIGWIAPEDFDGSDYGAYLAGLSIAECEYGPSTKWNAFQYEETFGEFSRSSDTFTIRDTFVLQFDYERDPRFRVRGPGAGLPLANDEDWGVARTIQDAQNHLSWNIIYGDGTNSTEEWNGLDQILTAGYVAARTVTGSTGTVDFADPVIVDGTTLPTIASAVQAIRQMVRFIRYRASQRNLSIADNDMALVMPVATWHAIAEYLAVNGMVTSITRTEVSGDAEARLGTIMSGGVGDGAFSVDNRAVPILLDDSLGALTNNDTTVTSDIFLLTRRIGNETILEQQYLDYSLAQKSNALGLDINIRTGLGGLIRYGWVVENQKCFYYFTEMGGRLLSRAQPYQGRITSLTVPLNAPFTLEANSYTDAFWGTVLNSGTLPAGV